MNFLLWIILIVWGVIVATIIYKDIRKERFASSNIPGLGDDDQNVIKSVPLDLTTKYPNAFYHEMNNADFEKALKLTFASDKTCSPLKMALQNKDWKLIGQDEPFGIQQIYENVAIKGMRTMLKNSPHFAKVPGVVQIVYEDRQKTFKHVTSPNTYLIYSEMIMYRENKYHAKHVATNIVLKQNAKDVWEYQVVTVEVLGILFEDKVAMYPVSANNPFDRHEMIFDENPYVQAPAVLLDNETVISLVQKQSLNNQKLVESELAINPSK